MAAKENEHYWRLYLYLNEGVSFLSKDIIVRKLDVLGQDLSCLLRKNEGNIRKKMRLDATDLNVLFPADGETNMIKWSANLYLCVIIALFRASLKPNEWTKLKVIQNILQDLLDMQDDTTIDNQIYEGHVQNLEEAFLVLTSNEESTMKMVEMKTFYIDQPLESSPLPRETAEMYVPSGLNVKLAEFLKQITSTDTVRSDEIGQCENSKASGGEQRHKMHDSENQTEDAVVNNSIQDNNADFGKDEIDAGAINGDQENTSDGIGVCATNENSENSSDGIGTVVTAADVENEIVRIANTPQTAEETRCVARQLDMKRFEKSLRQKDLETLISEELNTWTKEHVNIAVIGRSGVGKSRFINAIRGCKEGDPDYAKIGEIETTISVQKYPDPNNSLLVYWDLPGLGTAKFPRDIYTQMKEINFNSYDIYLLLSATRFMEDDDYLAKKIVESGKPFLFVRTKVDINAEEYMDFKSKLEEIRKECVEKLSLMKIQASDVYLISSKIVEHKLFDFGRLVERLVVSLPDLKKEALLNTCRFNTRALIREKKTQLTNRAAKASVASGAAGAVPVPGFSFCVDSKIIINEINAYRDILFINEKDLENLAMKTRIVVNDLKKRYKLKSFTFFTAKGVVQFSTILTLIRTIAMSEVAENTVKLLIPVVGSFIGAGISCYTTYKLLTSMIEIFVQDAEKMLDILLEKTGSSIFQSN